ncbi:MAG: 50S ribosomal protein L32 [Candidatus Cyclonatronum sp.]|uniref:50S ribosomal protein L32 n=1 Tax=Cyclonatronum sp. TaxID=3024185 RepID=UPI0025BB63D7|nr:50S ribosomal protein L32 [Cyclonatronum sp.]MCC5933692.1 50S ribosomal protein L32 [Balneolales bacterium]MCH8486876.1 50S ribosomal protein L32 [Cyclonatronum sp.]
MAHPKRKTSKARKNKRRTHHKLEDVTLSTCSNCGSVHRAHHACADCGYYRGRQVLAVN